MPSRSSLVLLPLALATGLGRRLGAAHRRLAERLLGERVPGPPVLPRQGALGRLGAGLRDGPSWRALAYTLLKAPIAVAEGYAVFLWVAGLANLTYPFWWGLFRNHPPGVRLSPVLVGTPFPGRRAPHRHLSRARSCAFAAGAVHGAGRPLGDQGGRGRRPPAAPGAAGPGPAGRAGPRPGADPGAGRGRLGHAAAPVERDLHDGAQIRLATLAMNLGMAREKLGDDGDLPDVAGARELVDAAHRNAKDALAELRDLARGIHPPVLDNGLADALATLAAGSAIPVELATDIPVRPTPAIETIAYFCAAELLANAAKHSFADRIVLRATGRGELLLLSVTDDGAGGADPGGSGLSGLAQRVSTVDGRLDGREPARRPDKDHRRAAAARVRACRSCGS